MALSNFNYWTPNGYKDPYTNTSWSDTTYGDQSRELAPDAAYYRYGVTSGVPDDGSAFSRWFKQQYGDVYRGYQAATIDNPYLMIDPYLNSLGGYNQWIQRYLSQAPQLRGEDPSSAGAGVVRVIPR